MSAETLIQYGMVRIGSFSIRDDAFVLAIENIEMLEQERCIYAFLIDDEIVRIGSSKAKLKSRLRDWRRDVSVALAGRKSHTSTNEADSWRDRLADKTGRIFARPGHIVRTPVGEISAYLDEESTLIARHKPRFCKR